MPTYDFRCLACNNVFSQKLSFSERKNAACEKCGSREVEQLFRKCNVLGGSSSVSEDMAGGKSACSRTGGCSGCAGC